MFVILTLTLRRANFPVTLIRATSGPHPSKVFPRVFHLCFCFFPSAGSGSLGSRRRERSLNFFFWTPTWCSPIASWSSSLIFLPSTLVAFSPERVVLPVFPSGLTALRVSLSFMFFFFSFEAVFDRYRSSRNPAPSTSSLPAICLRSIKSFMFVVTHLLLLYTQLVLPAFVLSKRNTEVEGGRGVIRPPPSSTPF